MAQLLLKSIFRLLIGKDQLDLYENLDWENQSDRFRQPELVYPDYYSTQNFHGIEGGYLNAVAAVTYDAVTAFASPPSETKVRQELLCRIEGQPSKILDLGCGTGSSTLMLTQAFPHAKVVGLDLSPYMLVMAQHKAKQAGLNIDWHHGLAEATSFTDSSFDLVSTSFLFHEMPPQISQLVIKECFRLLKPGGQLLILDGNQKILRHADLLIKLFREPYSQVYAAESVDAWLKETNFEQVKTDYVGWIGQVTKGVKMTAKNK